MTTLEQLNALQASIGESVLGQDHVIRQILIGMLANGHLLLESLPGLAKTRTVKALAKHLDAKMSRIQFTPDLLPSDITGAEVLHQVEGLNRILFQPGPLFGNLILADEINRAPAKVQAALLEAMEERQITVAGNSHPLPELFMVLATQNPIDMAGTHALPEAQLDRFFVRLSVGYPSLDDELSILSAQAQAHPIESLQAVTTEADILAAREAAKGVHLSPDVARYAARIVAATREHADLRLGASPRGTLALARGSQAFAYLRDKKFVTPDIVKAMAAPILEHRLIVRPQAAAMGQSARSILKSILDNLAPPV